jgi:hypothetical protein
MYMDKCKKKTMNVVKDTVSSVTVDEDNLHTKRMVTRIIRHLHHHLLQVQQVR